MAETAIETAVPAPFVYSVGKLASAGNGEIRRRKYLVAMTKTGKWGEQCVKG